jgi:hypothetical protein
MGGGLSTLCPVTAIEICESFSVGQNHTGAGTTAVYISQQFNGASPFKSVKSRNGIPVISVSALAGHSEGYPRYSPRGS